MTKLEEWAKQKGLECSAINDAEMAQFWLRAFVKEVRERSLKAGRSLITYNDDTGYAFNKIVKEYGLEGKT